MYIYMYTSVRYVMSVACAMAGFSANDTRAPLCYALSLSLCVIKAGYSWLSVIGGFLSAHRDIGEGAAQF